MEKDNERYQKSKIYKLVDNITGNIYIGATYEKTLSRRLSKHVYDLKRFKKGNYHFVSSFIILENNDYYIELIENCPCECKDELTKRERFHIQQNKCVNRNLKKVIKDKK